MLESFVSQALQKLFEDDVVLQLSRSNIIKRMAKKSNLEKLRAIKGIVMLIKGEKNWLNKNYHCAKKMFFSRYFYRRFMRHLLLQKQSDQPKRQNQNCQDPS